MFGMVLWILGFASLIAAWFGIYRSSLIQQALQAKQVAPYGGNPLIFGLEPLGWYWNALVLGVLAAGLKAGKKGGCCGSCNSCEAPAMPQA